MLRVHQVKLPLDAAACLNDGMLRALCAKAIHVPIQSIAAISLFRRSVDARDKGDVHFSLTIDVYLVGGEEAENIVAAKFRPNQITQISTSSRPVQGGLLHFPFAPWPKGLPRPLVVGAGPAGLFCALALALRGAKPLLVERGQPVERRTLDVDLFETMAQLDVESNVLFGEGGAGAFSDGKLTCSTGNPHIRTVLQTLVACGAPPEILTAQKPHIGTDVLRHVLREIRALLEKNGAQVYFGHRLEGLRIQDGQVTGAVIGKGHKTEVWDVQTLCLAIGHSARDTYTWLHSQGVPMQAKPFAVGVRIEHLQTKINRAQYGSAFVHPALPPAEYKLNVRTPDERGVYTFCMCPGGQVIGAMNQAETMNVNGMSYHARDGENANAALLVGVHPRDFGETDPLAGIAFQLQIEHAAYRLSGFQAPCQRVEDFLKGRFTQRSGDVLPTYLPGVALGSVEACLPPFVVENLRYAIPRLGQRLQGFDHPDALLTAPEACSSSPVRILRNSRRESILRGLYPLGEGAGYAGGIVSAAVDGMLAGMEIEEGKS